MEASQGGWMTLTLDDMTTDVGRLLGVGDGSQLLSGGGEGLTFFRQFVIYDIYLIQRLGSRPIATQLARGALPPALRRCASLSRSIIIVYAIFPSFFTAVLYCICL